MSRSQSHSNRAAFDKVATTYDANFTNTDIGYWLRKRVWSRMAMHFQTGDTVLELGCGTGEDAVWLAQHGVHVVATDVSLTMLERTRQKAIEAGVENAVEVHPLDLNALDDDALRRRFDGAYSNFGPVNCTPDWTALAHWLARRVKPEGIVGLGMMSRFCLWETLWHAVHLDFKTATRRWSGQTDAVLPDGVTFEVYYPTVRTLTRRFRPCFTRTNLQGIGVFLPPSDAFAPVEKYPRLLAVLTVLEKHLAHRWPLHSIADHYWIEFRRNVTYTETVRS